MEGNILHGIMYEINNKKNFNPWGIVRQVHGTRNEAENLHDLQSLNNKYDILVFSFFFFFFCLSHSQTSMYSIGTKYGCYNNNLVTKLKFY